jgi:hypothetical protein
VCHADCDFSDFNGDNTFFSYGTTIVLEDCNFNYNSASRNGGHLQLGNVTSCQLIGQTGFGPSKAGADVFLEEPTSGFYSDRLVNDSSTDLNKASKADKQVLEPPVSAAAHCAASCPLFVNGSAAFQLVLRTNIRWHVLLHGVTLKLHMCPLARGTRTEGSAEMLSSCRRLTMHQRM